jgi:hypothetical protein
MHSRMEESEERTDCKVSSVMIGCDCLNRLHAITSYEFLHRVVLSNNLPQFHFGFH